MYSKAENIIIAFHGCDITIRDSVINGGNLLPSVNDYDWLGPGIYFWENDDTRAKEWADDLSKRSYSKIKTPAVLGAVIDLGRCLDLTNRINIPLLKSGYEWLKNSREHQGIKLPQNENIGENQDLLKRYLDCAVINSIHEMNRSKGLQPFDSVRCMFAEGDPAYNGSGFKAKTHSQICILNPNCIKGYFLPREIDSSYPIP